MSESLASDLAMAVMRLESVRKAQWSDSPTSTSTIKAIDDLNAAISAIAQRAIGAAS